MLVIIVVVFASDLRLLTSNMFYTQSDRMFTENAEGRDMRNGPLVPLHNPNDYGEKPHQPEEAASSSGSDVDDGTWGERDVGGPVNLRHAMADYEEMRKDLTKLSKTRSRNTQRSKSRTRRSSTALRRHISRASHATSGAGRDVEAQHRDESIEKPAEAEEEAEDFELGEFLKDGHFEKRVEGASAKKVGVVYKNLTVQGVGATTAFVKTLPSAVLGVS